jgi:hypothetical protein
MIWNSHERTKTTSTQCGVIFHGVGYDILECDWREGPNRFIFWVKITTTIYLSAYPPWNEQNKKKKRNILAKEGAIAILFLSKNQSELLYTSHAFLYRNQKNAIDYRVLVE